MLKKLNEFEQPEELVNNDSTFIELEKLLLNNENIHNVLKNNEDVVYRKIKVSENISVDVVFVDGMINSSMASEFILQPLVKNEFFKKIIAQKELIKKIQEGQIYFANQVTRDNLKDCIGDILTGSIAIIFEKENIAITFDDKGFDKRGIGEPTGENVVKGSKDSFVETLRVNTATIRRKIKSHDLKLESSIVGKQTQTNIDIVYLESITNKKLVNIIKDKLSKIAIDGALSTSYIEEYLFDNNTVFPQLIYTERPDKFCQNIIEGYVGLIIDGIPLGIILPATLLQCIQAPEDYAQNYTISSIVRFMRFCLMGLTLILPSIYIAVTTFHQEMIPTELALFIESSKDGVPFPTFVEVIFMLLAFEVLVEAGLRLPKSIGSAVSIVGSMIVGQAAVEAKLVSPSVVVIIAITAIASFTMPTQEFSNALRLWRFIFVLFSSILGLFGLTIGGLILLAHLASLDVMGVPYLAPFAGAKTGSNDTIFRKIIRRHKLRPSYLDTKDVGRG